MRAATSIVTAAIALFLLSGCVPQPSPATPTPVASSTPVFASDEEALAAATAAYAAYLAVSDQICADGGANPERLAPFVTADWLAKETSVYANFATTGNSLKGETAFRDAVIQQVAQDQSGNFSVVIYVCTDFSRTKFINSDGVDVTKPDRQLSATIQVSFSSDARSAHQLLIAGSEPWETQTNC